ncbi:UDP-N-acetylglucosamine 1-carboxyvinyltransferase [Streptomyces lichenis]|uniref:UDP-N-acetylglucosamine 1-carboxyvinyltransferase n=1 Tax=Streptomyces lichenis TaxID=2306967 RepID=A0ABT0IFT8_9ACTN|nr:UDP-N-acetylglucosamine 1-carboxyvinyltransferase [Streptomyces lichenis]MCK8680161.1 UDP-N-acetylglucosamine 1-carboxyvinyltransferase [Streptomyces lichenis]
MKVTGGKALSGDYQVQGGKNIALHLYAAALLADEAVTLRDAPAILDTEVCVRLLRHTGTGASFDGQDFTVVPSAAPLPVVHPEAGRLIRTTAVLGAALLAKTGLVEFPHPGGDAFCPRLIDRHLAAMQAAGAEVLVSEEGVRAFLGHRGVRPFTVDVGTPYGPSLGATVTALLLAACCPRTSLITNPSVEPEVIEVARFLADRGVAVCRDAAGLHVTGTGHIGGGAFPVLGDRIEAATVAMAAVATGGRVTLRGVTLRDLPSGLVSALTAVGVLFSPGQNALDVRPGRSLSAIQTLTGPHPGLPTDTAPQLAALLTQAAGTSVIHERVYPRRDSHVAPLRAFGARVGSTGPLVSVEGASCLRAAEVEAADIRAGAALLIAALVADGTSVIRGLRHLRRGYGHLLRGLATLGAEITTEPETK